jgi:hypothetical protein
LNTPEPEISEDIQEIEFDEMWHFRKKKTTNFGSSRRLTVAAGELSDGLSAVAKKLHGCNVPAIVPQSETPERCGVLHG